MCNVSRRSFIKGMCYAGGLSFLNLKSGVAFAQSLCETRRKTLVVVNLSGGPHSLSILVPRTIQSYFDKHPDIGVQNSSILTNSIGLHPAMTNLLDIYNGQVPGIGVALCNQIGIMDQAGKDVNSRSHDVATQQYASALINPYGTITSGWLGRYAGLHCHGTGAAYSLVRLGGVARTLDASGIYPVSADNLSSMVYQNDNSSLGNVSGVSTLSKNKYVRDSIHEINGLSDYSEDRPHSELFKITHQGADNAVDMLAQVRTAYTAPPDGTYTAGNPLNQRFMDAAALINSWSLTKASVIALSQGGYDTHGGQGTSNLVNGNYTGLARSLQQLDQAIGGFFRDLQNRSLADQVVVLLVGEFGRTFQNNNILADGTPSPGTDHGTGGICMVVGAGVRSFIPYCNYTNAHFETNNLNRLKTEVDVRSVYAEILENHLGVNSSPIFPEAYVRTNLNMFV